MKVYDMTPRERRDWAIGNLILDIRAYHISLGAQRVTFHGEVEEALAWSERELTVRLMEARESA